VLKKFNPSENFIKDFGLTRNNPRNYFYYIFQWSSNVSERVLAFHCRYVNLFQKNLTCSKVFIVYLSQTRGPYHKHNRRTQEQKCVATAHRITE